MITDEIQKIVKKVFVENFLIEHPENGVEASKKAAMELEKLVKDKYNREKVSLRSFTVQYTLDGPEVIASFEIDKAKCNFYMEFNTSVNVEYTVLGE